MIDTRVDIPGDGRMYICVRLCAPMIANLLGLAPEVRKCTRIKLNGEPCAGDALPGRDVCVAHAKQERKANVALAEAH